MNILQPILRFLLYCAVGYIVIRFIWAIRTIAQDIRRKKKKDHRWVIEKARRLPCSD